MTLNILLGITCIYRLRAYNILLQQTNGFYEFTIFNYILTTTVKYYHINILITNNQKKIHPGLKT